MALILHSKHSLHQYIKQMFTYYMYVHISQAQGPIHSDQESSSMYWFHNGLNMRKCVQDIYRRCYGCQTIVPNIRNRAIQSLLFFFSSKDGTVYWSVSPALQNKVSQQFVLRFALDMSLRNLPALRVGPQQLGGTVRALNIPKFSFLMSGIFGQFIELFTVTWLLVSPVSTCLFYLCASSLINNW